MWKWIHLVVMLLVSHGILYISEYFLILSELIFDLIVTWLLNHIDTPFKKSCSTKCDQRELIFFVFMLFQINFLPKFIYKLKIKGEN